MAQGQGGERAGRGTAAPHFPFQPQDFPGERPAALVTSQQVRGQPTRSNRGCVGTAASPWGSLRPECQASTPAALLCGLSEPQGCSGPRFCTCRVD